MADWITHIAVAYALFTVASWRLDWLDSRWIVVGIVGSILPDLNRVRLLVDGDLITAVLGIPFEWGGLHTLGGVLLMAAVGALLFDREDDDRWLDRDQRRAFGLLLVGALSHIAVDLPQPYADGRLLTNIYFFPFTSWRGPTPGWYVSADRWVAVVAVGIALAVFLADRYRTATESAVT